MASPSYGSTEATAPEQPQQPDDLEASRSPKSAEARSTHSQSTHGHSGPAHKLDDSPIEPAPDSDDESSVVKQDGVLEAEAMSKVWSPRVLVCIIALLYLFQFVDILLTYVQVNLNPYVTSSFGQHGLLSTVSIVSTIIGGVCALTIAKVIDIWGRATGFLVMTALTVLGCVMKAKCVNVQMYAAADTFYWVGHLGTSYIIRIILADNTTLQNRMILIAIMDTPSVAATFAGSRIADLFYHHSSFRWAFGAFAIMLAAFCLPIVTIFFVTQRKALRLGYLLPRRHARTTWWASLRYYFVQFDVVGMLLTTLGWSLLLLPFSLADSAPRGWKSGYIVAMIVLGLFLLAMFVVWEKYLATVPYFPLKYLQNRGVFGPCLAYGLMFLSIYCWDGYYTSYLQVVHNVEIDQAGYIANSFGLAAYIIGPLIGYLIRRTHRFKWLALVACPFVLLGTALLIHFRRPGTSIAYLVMCQCFNGIGTQIWNLAGQISIMANIPHQEVAVALALFGLFGSIGSSIGYAISGGIWTNLLPGEILAHLPENEKANASLIYGSLEVQLSYPPGSPVRDAIIAGYDFVQRRMVLAGSVVIPLVVGCVLLWRNVDVKEVDRRKGRLGALF